MSSSFFVKKKKVVSLKKRKREEKPKIPKKPPKEEEEIDSDAFDSEEADSVNGKAKTSKEYFSDEATEETPQDKRLRLAQLYLEEISKEEANRAEDKELRDVVSDRLRKDYLDSIGQLRRNIAGSIIGYNKDNIKFLKHKKHKLSICSIAISTDNEFLFSGAKMQFIVKWNLKTFKSEGVIDVQPHVGDPDNGVKRRSHIIAMCLSTDMKFLAIAEGGNNIQIWCPKQLKHLKTLKGHRDIVTSLVFRRDSHDLYSTSRDRSVNVWSIDEMSYVESLYGHQAGITAVDALSRERAVSSGGTDCSLRIWKINEESQLVYNGHKGSIDVVKYLNDENFVSCADDGSLCLWSTLKKKAVFTENSIHGSNWITALAVIVNSDLIATGSSDGCIRLWQSIDHNRKLKQMFEIPINGFVNALAFTKDGSRLIAGVGQEHRLGRWWRLKEARNHIVIFELQTNPSKS